MAEDEPTSTRKDDATSRKKRPPPTTTTTTTDALINECYYHGRLPREDVEYLLKANGDFLIRVSQPRNNDSDRQIILSLLVDKDVDTNIGLRHIVVRKQMGKYQVEEPHRFDLIQELVDHFLRTKTPILSNVLNSILVNPIGRQKWELRHSDIELTKRLGAGVYGEVYRGKMKRKNQVIDIAVKSAKTATLTKEGAKEMMREARMMRSYNHPNVVRIYGVALDDDPIMIVMELVRGGSLQDYLKKNAGKINDTERLNNMASSAACGLAYLHSRSCIHRDIAARNCLYDKKKNVKISDFGLSREGEEYKMTQTQRVPMKSMAPECFTNFTFTRSSDVFSFGVLLWEIFSDAAEPFEGIKTAEMKNLILNGVRLEFPAATPPQITEMVTQHLWSSRPEDRYRMDQIVEGLKLIVEMEAERKDKKEIQREDTVKGSDIKIKKKKTKSRSRASQNRANMKKCQIGNAEGKGNSLNQS